MVLHRSGETTDDFIADLAVASGYQLKFDAPARGEHVAEYYLSPPSRPSWWTPAYGSSQ